MNTDMLTCEEALERMSQALDGLLPLEERQALEEHLESCPECRTAYEALFQMEDALREIGETPAPAELSARVMEQIQAEAAPARRPAPRWNRAGWRNLAGLAACAVLCLGLWHGAGLGSRENVVDEPSAASQSAGQEDASSRGLLDEMEPAQEDPADAQPAPAQADAPEEDAPEKAESSLPSGQEETACSQTEEALAADTRSILEQESPEVPEAYAHMPDADSSGSQSEQEPVTIQEPEEETEPQVQGGAPDALLQDEPELDSQTQGTKQDEQAQEPGPDGAAAEPLENGAAAETAPPPWGEGTAPGAVRPSPGGGGASPRPGGVDPGGGRHPLVYCDGGGAGGRSGPPRPAGCGGGPPGAALDRALRCGAPPSGGTPIQPGGAGQLNDFLPARIRAGFFMPGIRLVNLNKRAVFSYFSKK